MFSYVCFGDFRNFRTPSYTPNWDSRYLYKNRIKTSMIEVHRQSVLTTSIAILVDER